MPDKKHINFTDTLRTCKKELKNNTDPVKVFKKLQYNISYYYSFSQVLKADKLISNIIDRLKNENTDYYKRLGLKKIRIAFLGDFTSTHYLPVLNVLLVKENFLPEMYTNQYNSMVHDIVNRDSDFYRFAPEITIIYANIRDIKVFPCVNDTLENVKSMVDRNIQAYVHLWETILGRVKTFIVQNNFEVPVTRIFGSMENKLVYSRTNFVRRMNLQLNEQAVSRGSVVVNDIDHIASCQGKYEWFDERFWYHSQHQHSIECASQSIKNIVKIILAVNGLSKKCAVLDLDNTLWGGVIGDDGLENIELGPDGVGQAFMDFQEYLLALKQRGVILAVCSKNEEDIAREVFEKHEHMILSLEDISCFKANWDNKANNIAAIAGELNIGLDSLVFIDDNPAEREIVRQSLPDVAVPELPEDPSQYCTFLDSCNYFELVHFAVEDKERGEYYAREKKRKAWGVLFNNIDEYLKSLEMEAVINTFDDTHLPRIVQLINKTNQFNLTTRRYNNEEVREFMSKPEFLTLYVKIRDTFGDYGLISVLIGRIVRDVLDVDTWLMSCRVLNKGVEYLLLDRLYREAVKMKIAAIKGKYIPTAKNKLVKDHYLKLGFTLSAEEEGEYILSLKKYTRKKYFIREITC